MAHEVVAHWEAVYRGRDPATFADGQQLKLSFGQDRLAGATP